MTKKILSCFFIGHRDAPESLLPLLTDAVERHTIDYGVYSFVTGHYGAFDRMAASAVIAAKKRHENVMLQMLIPYHPAANPIEPRSGFDGTFYPPGMEKVPHRAAILRANEYMIRTSTHLIAYCCYDFSNTYKLLEIAKRRENGASLRIENLADAIRFVGR